MPPTADLKVLHGLLVADEAKRRKRDAEMKALAPSLQDADAKIRTALEDFGVLPPSEEPHCEEPPRQLGLMPPVLSFARWRRSRRRRRLCESRRLRRGQMCACSTTA